MMDNTSQLLKVWERGLQSEAMAHKTIQTYLRWGGRMAVRWPKITETTFPECVIIASASLRRQCYSATTIHGFQCAMASFTFHVWKWDEERRKGLITARPVKSSHQVPSSEDVRQFLDCLKGEARVVALLCYCCGLRISEAMELQLCDVDLVGNKLNVRVSKGSKGRKVVIPPELVPIIRDQASYAMGLCETDLKRCDTFAPLTAQMWRYRPSMAMEPGQWPLFPQPSLFWDRNVKMNVRVFLHASIIERKFKECRMKSGVLCRITPHRLRDAYACHSLLAGVPINVIQEAMGHARIETTAKYLSGLLTDEGAAAFPGFNLFRNLFKSAGNPVDTTTQCA